jgi:hypothetical protein
MARIIPPLLLLIVTVVIAYFIIFRDPGKTPPIATQPAPPSQSGAP